MIAAMLRPLLLVGAIAGWSARNPDVMAIAGRRRRRLRRSLAGPGLGRRPQADQRRRAVAVRTLPGPARRVGRGVSGRPGYFPHSHETISKAYTQLARIWHRRSRRRGARGARRRPRPLEARPETRPGARRARPHRRSSCKNGDFDGVVEGMKALTKDDVSEIYDPALVELSLEVCADAMSRRPAPGPKRFCTSRSERAQLQAGPTDFSGSRCRAARPPSKAAAKSSRRTATIEVEGNQHSRDCGQTVIRAERTLSSRRRPAAGPVGRESREWHS